MWKQFVGEEMERKQDDLSLSLFTFLSRKLEEELPPTLLFPGANVDIKKKKKIADHPLPPTLLFPGANVDIKKKKKIADQNCSSLPLISLLVFNSFLG